MFSIVKFFRRVVTKSSLGSGKIALLCAINVVLSVSKPAAAQQFCGTSTSVHANEQTSETHRTVELSQLGVAVSVPENYRTMQLQNSDVRIVHPSIFDMLQCLTRGGRGGHGFYSETIGLVEDDLTMDLREQATWMVGYTQMNDGSRTPVAAQIISYEKDTLSGYIVMDETGYGVHFLGVLPGRDKLLKVSAECDCEVDVAAITNLLAGITVTN